MWRPGGVAPPCQSATTQPPRARSTAVFRLSGHVGVAFRCVFNIFGWADATLDAKADNMDSHLIGKPFTLQALSEGLQRASPSGSGHSWRFDWQKNGSRTGQVQAWPVLLLACNTGTDGPSQGA